MRRSSSDRVRRRPGRPVVLAVIASLLATEAAAQTRAPSFLGLTSPSAAVPDFWEGRTNYRVLMGCQQAGSEYLAWHKYKLGWLSDQNVLVAKKTSRTGLVTPIDEKGGVKAIVVPTSDVEAYVVEVRSRDGSPKSETGVLCYRVSLTIANGQGPIQVIPARPDDNNPALEKAFVTLYNALYSRGPVVEDADRRIKIEILGREGRAYRIGVTR